MNRKDRIQDFYNKMPSINAKNIPIQQLEHLTVGWRNKDSANGSYQAASVYPFQVCNEIKSVLDVGSGLGSFLSYLRNSKGFDGHYFGVEILEDFYTYGKEIHIKDAKATFACVDFLEMPLSDANFDWSFSIGSLSVIQDDQNKENRETILKMYALSNFGFSIFLNNAEKCKVLPGHNINAFVDLIQRLLPNCKEIIVNPFGGKSLQAKTMIHVLK
ncbi:MULTISPECIES: class I SAM-dependent methyltransferase [unclassified Lacinutrix]